MSITDLAGEMRVLGTGLIYGDPTYNNGKVRNGEIRDGLTSYRPVSLNNTLTHDRMKGIKLPDSCCVDVLFGLEFLLDSSIIHA